MNTLLSSCIFDCTKLWHKKLSTTLMCLRRKTAATTHILLREECAHVQFVCYHPFKTHFILLTPNNIKTTQSLWNHSNSFYTLIKVMKEQCVVFCFSVITEQLTFWRCTVLAASRNKLLIPWDIFWALAIIHRANKGSWWMCACISAVEYNSGSCFSSQCDANTTKYCGALSLPCFEHVCGVVICSKCYYILYLTPHLLIIHVL